MEDPKPSDDVIVENPPVNESPATSEQETQEVATETQEAEQPQEIQQEPQDRPTKNVDAEWRRKYENLVTQLPQMVGQELQKHLPKQQQEQPKYTVKELREFAIKNPDHAGWVEEQIVEIQKEETRKVLREELENQQKTIQSNIAKQKAEESVLSNVKYQDAFVTLANGQKTWNPDSKLAQTIGQYMQDPDLSRRPDGLAIAAKLAYGDILESGEITAQRKLATVKRQNQVLKTKVMPEGGGVPVVPKTKDPYVESVNRLRSSGRIEDAKVAVSAYLSNLLKD